MDNPQDAVAVLYAVNQDTDCQKVIDFIDAFVVFLHLLVDAVKALGTALDFTFDPTITAQMAQFVHGFLDHGFPFVPFDLDLLHKLIVMLRLHVAERQIFQFPFDGIDS